MKGRTPSCWAWPQDMVGRLSFFAPRTSPVEVVQLSWKQSLPIYNSTRGLPTKGSWDCLHTEERVRSEKYLAWVFFFPHFLFIPEKKNQSFLLEKQPELKHTWGLKSSWTRAVFLLLPLGRWFKFSSQEGNGLEGKGSARAIWVKPVWCLHGWAAHLCIQPEGCIYFCYVEINLQSKRMLLGQRKCYPKAQMLPLSTVSHQPPVSPPPKQSLLQGLSTLFVYTPTPFRTLCWG